MCAGSASIAKQIVMNVISMPAANVPSMRERVSVPEW